MPIRARNCTAARFDKGDNITNKTHTAKETTATLLDALKHQGLCLKEALQIIEKGEEMAEIIHVPMAITMVDEGGNTVAMHRMNDSLLASISISYPKAYMAATLRAPTGETARDILPGQPLHGLQQTHPGKFRIFGGGIPIVKNGHCIGGLDVSGGTMEQNMIVARHALSLD